MRHTKRYGLLFVVMAVVMMLACGGTVLAETADKDFEQSTNTTSLDRW
jgi:hypothetical protein